MSVIKVYVNKRFGPVQKGKHQYVRSCGTTCKSETLLTNICQYFEFGMVDISVMFIVIVPKVLHYTVKQT